MSLLVSRSTGSQPPTDMNLGERTSLLTPSLAASRSSTSITNEPSAYTQLSFTKSQILLFCIVLLTEPLYHTQALPYLNEFVYTVKEGRDTTSVGFYSGLTETLFRILQLVTAYQWIMLSDAFGRVPLVAVGIIGCTLGTFGFGLSTTILQLVAARALVGLCSGTFTVYYAVMAELTSSSNQAIVYPLFSIALSIGSICGTLIGGFLSYPAEHFRAFARVHFFFEFPYLLPCLVTGGAGSVALLTLIALDETQPIHRYLRTIVEQGHILNLRRAAIEPPLTLPELLSTPLLRKLTISNTLLTFLSAALQTLFILFCYHPHTGLGLSTTEISIVLLFGHIVYLLISVLILPLAYNFMHLDIVYKLASFCYPIASALFPFIQHLNHGSDGETRSTSFWYALGLIQILLQLGGVYQMSVYLRALDALRTVVKTCVLTVNFYSTALMLAREYSPNINSLGAVYGLLQTFALLARAFAPFVAGSLFAWAAHQQFMVIGGTTHIFVFSIMTLLTLSVALHARSLKSRNSYIVLG